MGQLYATIVMKRQEARLQFYRGDGMNWVRLA